MMNKIKHGLSFIFGMIYISLLWLAIIITDVSIKSAIIYVFVIATMLVLTAIIVFLGDYWKND